MSSTMCGSVKLPLLDYNVAMGGGGGGGRGLAMFNTNADTQIALKQEVLINVVMKKVFNYDSLHSNVDTICTATAIVDLCR